MKRRNFLINSAAIFGGCTLFSGCKNELIKKEGTVTRRRFKDITLPLLGLGCMRLPMKNEKEIDMAELDKMVEYAMNHGVNYFDTGYFYVNSKSENAIGEILKKYKRESYFLADKAPIRQIRTKDDIRKIFDEQLKNCKSEYFDFYLAHSLKDGNYDAYKNIELHKELLELKKEGKIKYIGFSFHGTPENLKEIVNEGSWDFCQLQINYFDWDVIKAREQYEIVQQKKIPVTVMEPLRGGLLADLPTKASDELKKNYPDITPANFGLRWAASLDNIMTVLSGMSNFEQMKENVAAFEHFKVMTDDEKEFAKKLTGTIQLQGKINCSNCKHCLEDCPKNINIPAIFAIYNQFKLLNNKSKFAFYYETLSEKERANKCIKCGLCNKNCPQNINIPELLAEISSEYDKR